MEQLIPIENNSNLVRNMLNNGVINTNQDQYKRYLHTKEQREKEKDKINSIETELHYVKTELSEIKQLLLKFSTQ